MRSLLREVLVDAGYAVMTAESADAARSLASEFELDLFILDAALADPADEALLAALAELRPEARALLLTTSDEREAAEQLAAEGRALALAKPFDAAALLEAVEHAVASDEASSDGDGGG